MYRHILVPLDNSAVDEVILRHVRELARVGGVRLTLIHVADGHVARTFDQLNLAESSEMVRDRDYLAARQRELAAEGFDVAAHLACGEPAREILAFAATQDCDLIAMATHGHGPFADFFLGSVAEQIRHRTDLPILLIRAPKSLRATPGGARA